MVQFACENSFSVVLFFLVINLKSKISVIQWQGLFHHSFFFLSVGQKGSLKLCALFVQLFSSISLTRFLLSVPFAAKGDSFI